MTFMWKVFCVVGVFGLATVGLIWAQYPGQYPSGQGPYPAGQGQYPSGGLSIPRISKKKNKKAAEESQPVIAADGVTTSNDGKKLVVATKDGRWLTMTIVPTTQWLQAGKTVTSGQVTPHTHVHVEAAEDDEAYLTAKSVEVKDEPETAEAAATPGAEGTKAPGSTGAAAPASNSSGDEEMAQSTILKDTNESPDRPRLRRGKPTTKDDSSDSDTQESKPSKKAEVAQAEPPAKAAPSDGSIDFTINGETASMDKKRSTVYTKMIEQTSEWAQTFTNGLPNFLCEQITTRYFEPSKAEGFQAMDVLTAKVLYEDGREKYSEITVGGKRTNKSMMELGGSTSTGEFASVLGGLFERGTNTEFTFRESTTIEKQPAAIFDLRVALPRSNWTIIVGGQTLRPEYTGSVWVDKATNQVRRIEMQAEKIPKDFPYDLAAETVDYEEVPLGTSKFLLPVHAENLVCERGNSRCSKNTIDFRDYHKYSGESTIEFK